MLEADMLREYRLDLAEVLPKLSWRRFMVLVRGLSPNSATVTKVQEHRRKFSGTDQVNVMRTPEEAQAAFERLFAPPAGKQH